MIYIGLHCVRLCLIIASVVLLYFEDGREVLFGFWIITNFFVFIAQVCWGIYREIMKYRAGKTNKSEVTVG